MTRPGVLRRPRWLVGGAPACGAVAAGLVLTSPGGSVPASRALVATTALPAGTLLDEATLADRTVLRDVAGPALPGIVDDPAAAAGRRTTGPLGPGEPLTEALLGGSAAAVPPLRPGERAVPVPAAAAGGAAATLAPGMRVDVVASHGEGAVGRTEVVVPDAEVLAVDPAVAAGLVEAGPGGPAVLLRASSRDALVITSALNFAREVRLLVRPSEERGTPAPPRVEVR